ARSEACERAKLGRRHPLAELGDSFPVDAGAEDLKGRSDPLPEPEHFAPLGDRLGWPKPRLGRSGLECLQHGRHGLPAELVDSSEGLARFLGADDARLPPWVVARLEREPVESGEVAKLRLELLVAFTILFEVGVA